MNDFWPSKNKSKINDNKNKSRVNDYKNKKEDEVSVDNLRNFYRRESSPIKIDDGFREKMMAYYKGSSGSKSKKS